MFGAASFSQVPFSTLPFTAGTSFFDSLTENLGVADNNTQVWSFTQSITEPITEIDDFNLYCIFVCLASRGSVGTVEKYPLDII